MRDLYNNITAFGKVHFLHCCKAIVRVGEREKVIYALLLQSSVAPAVKALEACTLFACK